MELSNGDLCKSLLCLNSCACALAHYICKALLRFDSLCLRYLSCFGALARWCLVDVLRVTSMTNPGFSGKNGQ